MRVFNCVCKLDVAPLTKPSDVFVMVVAPATKLPVMVALPVKTELPFILTVEPGHTGFGLAVDSVHS